MIYGAVVDLLASSLSSMGEVVQAGDAGHGVMDAVAFESADSEDLPALHAGEGVFDAGADHRSLRIGSAPSRRNAVISLLN